jgi:uncharacterized protein with PIN domain
MLGSLARWLRFFGFDTEFCGPEMADEEVARRARQSGRWLLTRDRELASVGPRSTLIHAEDLESQLIEVFTRLGLEPEADLHNARCGECNGDLAAASDEEIRNLVPPYVQRTAQRFRRCLRCGRVYWPGTHTARITATMERVVGSLQV